MKNPFKHHAHGSTIQSPRVPDTPAELFGEAGEHPWHHMERDVDPDCARDPGSDLKASWDLEHAAAEEDLLADDRRPPEV